MQAYDDLTVQQVIEVMEQGDAFNDLLTTVANAASKFNPRRGRVRVLWRSSHEPLDPTMPWPEARDHVNAGRAFIAIDDGDGGAKVPERPLVEA